LYQEIQQAIPFPWAQDDSDEFSFIAVRGWVWVENLRILAQLAQFTARSPFRSLSIACEFHENEQGNLAEDAYRMVEDRGNAELVL
jgi:hypothetical protein